MGDGGVSGNGNKNIRGTYINDILHIQSTGVAPVTMAAWFRGRVGVEVHVKHRLNKNQLLVGQMLVMKGCDRCGEIIIYFYCKQT